MFKKIVIKVGTSTLTEGKERLSKRQMIELAREISKLHQSGVEIVLVTSGAIAAGKEILNLPKLERTLPAKQMFSSVGQINLMQRWQEHFSCYDIAIGQVLLTREDFSNRTSFLNARDTFQCLLKHHILPVVNENDTVATKEIRVGDNDNLAALTANLIHADTLILLTDQQGLYTEDPRKNGGAVLIPVVKKIDASIYKMATGSKGNLGTGGMFTKIQAAELAAESGVETVIASAKVEDVLLRLYKGEAIGTKFLAKSSAKESRKRWILSGKRKGTITIDAGAAKKLLHGGASLLASGIVSIDGDFERGESVSLLTDEKDCIAVGIARYSIEEMQKLIGKHSRTIESTLGFTRGPEMVHRDDLSMMEAHDA